MDEGESDPDISDLTINDYGVSNLQKVFATHQNIYYCNAQSLRNKIDCLEVEAIDMEAICLCETWLHSSIPSESLKIRGFELSERLVRLGDAHGGVCVYMKQGIRYCRRKDLEIVNLELIWLEVWWGNEKTLLGCGYRPPNSPNSLWADIQNNIENATDKRNMKMILCGDFNCNCLVKPNKIESLLKQCGAYVLNKEPTHVSTTSATCVDIFAATRPDLYHGVYNTSPTLSNHDGLILSLGLKKPTKLVYERKIFDYKNTDWLGLNTEIASHEWPSLDNNPDLDEVVRTWTEDYKALIEKYTPFKTVKIKSTDAKWITCEIKKLNKQKKKEYAKAKRKGHHKDHPGWEKYKRIRLLYQQKIKEAKENRLDKLAAKVNDPFILGSKEWFSLVSDLYKGTHEKGIHAELNSNGKTAKTNQEKADMLNSYFVGISNIEGHADQPDGELEMETDCVSDSVTLSREDVVNVLKNLKANKASGPDEIGNRILKYTATSTSIYLQKLFNYCLNSERMPTEWKYAKVSPIFKKGDRTKPENYRPVSLLSCVGKSLERCIHNKLMPYLEDNGLITPNQSAFRSGSSTVTQLLELINSLGKNLDSQKVSKILFCDVSKAFDRVWYGGLLQKLRAKGIQGKMLGWFRDYLHGRFQRVVLTGAYSRWMHILAGVPQGSILGPLLFLLYVDDVVRLLEANPRLFADDVLMMACGKTQKECCNQLKRDINELSRWSNTWKIKLNAKKTFCLTITRSDEPLMVLNMNGEPIINVTSHKHLGVSMEYNLKWNVHISDIINRAETRLAILRAYSGKFNRETLLLLYTCYIRPIIEYGDLIWFNLTEQDSERLEDLNRLGIRISIGAKAGTSHSFLYEESGLDTLSSRRKNHQLIMMMNIINNTRLCQLGTADLTPVGCRNRYPVRTSTKLSLIKCRTATYQGSLLPSGIKA